MKIGNYEVHPAAEAIPPMREEEYRWLVEDIRAHGLLEPIWLKDGQILDGRHRMRACVELSIEPKTREYDGDLPPATFAWSENGQRRHWTASQRAVYLLEYQKRTGINAAATRQADAAGVSERTMGQARAIADVPELIEAVKAGEISLVEAEKQIREPKPAKPTLDRAEHDAGGLAGLIVASVGGSHKYVNTTPRLAEVHVMYRDRKYLVRVSAE